MYVALMVCSTCTMFTPHSTIFVQPKTLKMLGQAIEDPHIVVHKRINSPAIEQMCTDGIKCY